MYFIVAVFFDHLNFALGANELVAVLVQAMPINYLTTALAKAQLAWLSLPMTVMWLVLLKVLCQIIAEVVAILQVKSSYSKNCY